MHLCTTVIASGRFNAVCILLGIWRINNAPNLIICTVILFFLWVGEQF